MQNIFEAKYFDGLSSKYSSVSLTISKSNELIHIIGNEELTQIDWCFSRLEFDKYHNVIEIRNRDFSGEILIVEDERFSKIFNELLNKRKGIDIHSRLLSLGIKRISIIAIFVLISISLSYILMLPKIAENSASLLPESFDDYVGDILSETILQNYKVDTVKTRLVQRFANELDFSNSRSLSITVVESSETNAFALPNGQIVIFSNIIRNMTSYEQLVALLAHEASHVNQRHGIKSLCRHVSSYIMISFIFTDINGVMSVIIENVHQLNSLSYSRDFERQADEEGLAILFNNNIDPIGFINLFEQLENSDNSNLPEIFSTHPLTNDRKDNINKIILNSSYDVKVNTFLADLFKQINNY